ncbi:hypothetical protein N9948_01120 [bacterium]|nr:hypothetical protein [bacterium]
MDKSKRVVQAFLNSAEGYFHKKRVLQDQVKQPRDLYGPMSDRPERWNYKDIRNITKIDLDRILVFALNKLDWELYQIIPSTALNAALQCSIHCLEYGQFQKKIDAKTYIMLLKILALKAKERGI